MGRRWVAVFTVLFLLVPVVAVAAPQWQADLEARVADLEARVSALEGISDTTTTSTLASSTTSSQPTTTVTSSTTSTLPATTTTTTQAPTTTTVPLSSTELSETLAYPSSRTSIRDGEGFFIETYCQDADIACPSGDDSLLGRFTYVGHGMPYLYSEAVAGNHDHAWWVAGDRDSYSCAYAFMYDKHPNPFGGFEEPREAEFIARATVVRPPGQGYGKVNDRYMLEDQRYYDGTFYLGSNISDVQDCDPEALDDFDYDSYQPHGPDEIRVGLLRGDGEVADIRDFVRVDHRDSWFEFLSLEERSFTQNGRTYTVERATVLQVLEGEGVSQVLYYDTLNTGRIVVEVNGQLIGG